MPPFEDKVVDQLTTVVQELRANPRGVADDVALVNGRNEFPRKLDEPPPVGGCVELSKNQFRESWVQGGFEESREPDHLQALPRAVPSDRVGFPPADKRRVGTD